MSGYSYLKSVVLPSDQVINDHVCVKTYLEIKIAQILNRSIPEHDEVWEEMTNHHCFRGNDVKMILDQFWHEEEEGAYGPSPVHDFVMNYIKEHNIDVSQYDDILLDITW